MDLPEFLSEVFLFDGMNKNQIRNAIGIISPIITEYERKNEIYSPSSYERRLGFIIRGECRVDRIRHDGVLVRLNVLKKGNSFGVVSVFADEEEFPTKITATKNTTVLYISKADIERLIIIFAKFCQKGK